MLNTFIFTFKIGKLCRGYSDVINKNNIHFRIIL